MAIACLNNLIGIDNTCNTIAPSSGLNINTFLSGITLQVGDQIAHQENESGVQAINNKIDIAQEKMVQDIRAQLLPKMKTRSIIDSNTVGHYVQNIYQNIIPAEAGRLKGIFFDINDRNYMSLHINSIKLQLNVAVTTNILISTPMTDSAQDPFPITTVAGADTQIIVNQSFPIVNQRLQLLIVYDAGVGESFQTNLSPSGSGCSDCNGRVYQDRMINFRAVSAAVGGAAPNFLTEAGLTTIGTTGGISVNYSLRCDVVPFVCNIADALAIPLMYKTGIEIIQEIQTSQRMNSLVIIHRDDYDLYKEELQEQYENSMEQIMSNVSLPQDNLCFQCKQWIRTKVMVP